MSHWLLYWVLMMDNIKSSCGPTCVISVAVFLFSFLMLNIAYYMRADGDEEIAPVVIKICKPIVKITLITLIISSCVSTFLPSTKQAAAIYLIPQMAHNKDLQQIPPKLTKLANAYLSNEIKSLTNEGN